MNQYLLTLLIAIPFVAAIGSLVVPLKSTQFRWLTLFASVIQLTILVFAFQQYDTHTTGLQLIEKQDWIRVQLGAGRSLKAEYFLGVDGLSLPLVALSVFILLIASVSSWHIKKNVRGYFVLLLILNAALIGTFTAQDFLLFYLFFEFMLLPMFFLIGIWGGPRREYASIKFFLYTLLGSILILLVMIGLYLSTNSGEIGEGLVHSFSLVDMQHPESIIANSVLDPVRNLTVGGVGIRTWAFLFLFIGFAIKLPMVPFHTWLPDAHVEAPTPISVILAALLLKIGGYGLLRIAYPIFPDAATTLSWLVGLFGVISIIYGALNALASKDLKRLIAYSSVSQMGFVLLGIASVTPEGIAGASYQMVSHGFISAMLFLLAGVLYDRTGDRTITNYSGLASKMPVYFSFTLLAFFASLGLPGLSGFMAELMVFLGAFQSNSVNGLLHESLAIVGTFGLVLSAAYYLWTLQRMFFGGYHLKGNSIDTHLYDLTFREKLLLLPLAIAIVVFGIFPQVLLNFLNPFAEQFTASVLETGKTLRSLIP